jgi:hypothetical protein
VVKVIGNSISTQTGGRGGDGGAGGAGGTGGSPGRGGTACTTEVGAGGGGGRGGDGGAGGNGSGGAGGPSIAVYSNGTVLNESGNTFSIKAGGQGGAGGAAPGSVAAPAGPGGISQNVLRVAPPAITGLVINEVDYDQLNTDTNEFVEIYNTGLAPADLSEVAIVFVNGVGSAEYRRVSLASVGVLNPGQYLVVATASLLPTVAPDARTISFGPGGDYIQNGAPDGIALIFTGGPTLLDALSYEGSITSANITGFPAPVNLVEGNPLAASVADSNTGNASLVRLPNGTDANNADTDWLLTNTPTPGAANN